MELHEIICQGNGQNFLDDINLKRRFRRRKKFFIPRISLASREVQMSSALQRNVSKKFLMTITKLQVQAWIFFSKTLYMLLRNMPEIMSILKVKVIPQQAEVAQGVPGSLRPRIFLTFGTTRVVGRQSYSPAAFTPK